MISLLLLAGCARSAPPPPAASRQPPFLLKASIREIMDAQIDPAADTLWESVAFEITAAGEETRQPRTPEEWQAVRRGAITLIEASNLLMMEGRRIAPQNVQLAPGELSPEVLQKKLDATHAPFDGFAQALQNTGLKALAAIDARDAGRLLEVGGEIDEACESCHLVYWYPP
jgi:hypothetical protein